MTNVAESSINSLPLGNTGQQIDTDYLLRRIHGLDESLQNALGLLLEEREASSRIAAENRALKAKLEDLLSDFKESKVYTVSGRVDDCFESLESIESRVAGLEGKKVVGKKVEARLEKVDSILVKRTNEPITFAELGKMLELGTHTGSKNTRKQNMTHLRKVLETKTDRYEIGSSRMGGKLLRLRRSYYNHLLKG